MRVIDMLSTFKGRQMLFLTPKGWFGRPWDTQVLTLKTLVKTQSG
jgi:hypothetical protein